MSVPDPTDGRDAATEIIPKTRYSIPIGADDGVRDYLGEDIDLGDGADG